MILRIVKFFQQSRLRLFFLLFPKGLKNSQDLLLLQEVLEFRLSAKVSLFLRLAKLSKQILLFFTTKVYNI